MNFIHYNPFRILGLPVDASEREITKRISDLELNMEFGKQVSYETDFPCLSSLQRSKDLVREAASRIETSESRFIYSLFWFWQRNMYDELALDVLKSGNVTKAISLLEGQLSAGVKDDNLFSSAKNLAVLYMAISKQNGSYNFEKFSKGMTWAARSFNEDLLSFYTKHVADKNFKIQKQKIIGFFIDEIEKTIIPLIDKPNGITLSAFITQFSSFPEETRRQVTSRLIGKHITNIENFIKTTEQARKKSPKNADKAGKKLFKDTSTDLNKLKEALSLDDFQYQAIADKLAEELFDCSVSYYNHYIDSDGEVDPGDNALWLAQNAYSIATGIKSQNRIKEGMLVYERWISGKNERKKQQKIKVDYDYIVNELNEVQKFDEFTELQINTLPELAQKFVNNCKTRLDNIRNTLGSNDKTFLDISSAVADTAMSMCICFANEKDEFTRILRIFNIIVTLAMKGDVKKRFDENFRILKQRARIKKDVSVIVTALGTVPDLNNLDSHEVTKLPEMVESLITLCKPRLAAIKDEDYELYKNLSSAVANNALGMCIEYANRTHDMTKINLMVMIGELDMEESLRQRYLTNQKIMRDNLSAPVRLVMRDKLPTPLRLPTSQSNCYIATMVYGSHDAPEVLVLRLYRDTVLSKSRLGRIFIKAYYRYSPLLVKKFGQNKAVCSFVKRLLDPIVRRLA